MGKTANTIHHCDCIELLRELPDESVDLVIADPPYNLKKNFGNKSDHWDKVEEWVDWCREWLNECVRVMKPGASIFVYGIHHYLCYLQCHLYEQGMSYRRVIIWNYENNFSGYTKTLAGHYEPILWFSKGKHFNYKVIREPYKSKDRLKYKVTKKDGSTWTPHPDGRIAGDVWRFPVLAGRRFADEKVNHPTQKPLALCDRLVNHFSNPGDLVLVPFAGSGSECVSAARNGRKYISAEINEEYIEIAKNRLNSIPLKLALD